MTREKAIELAKSGFYKELTPYEIVKFQLFEERLCMPFSVFHEACETVFNTPIYTHEFADVKDMRERFKKIKLKK